MRVLIIPSWYTQKDNPISGVFFREQALALQEQGLNVVVMYPKPSSIKEIFRKNRLSFEKVSIDEGMPTYRKSSSMYIPRIIKTYVYRYKKMALDLMEQVIKEQGMPDVIHAHSILYGGWIGSELSKKYNIPLIITEHSSAYSRNLILSKQTPYIIEALEQASQIIAVGEGLINELANYTTKEVKYVPNIVDVEAVNKFNVIKDLKKEEFIFFTLSLLSHNKRVDNIIKAFGEIAKYDQNVKLWIGGNGEEYSNLNELVKELKLEKQVHFLGMLTREEVYRKMNECDVFISASEVETFGVVLIEALSAGKPIIATASGGPNLIVNKDNGLLVEVNNVDALTKAMHQIKADYTSYDVEIIKSDCINKYSKKVVCKQLIKIYQEVIKSNIQGV